jgi:hypothetical protein
LKPAYEKYTSFLLRLNEGSLLFEEFEAFIKLLLHIKSDQEITGNWDERFRNSLKNATSEMLDQRIMQFGLYLKLTKINGIVKELIKIKNNNRLTQSFEFLENIEESVL